MKLKRIGMVICAGIAALSLQSNKAEALLAGVKTTGMAATSVSYPIDAFGGVYNPANITVICDRLDLGISWVHTKQSATIENLPDYSDPLNPIAVALLTLMGGTNPSSLNGTRDGAKTADLYVPEFGIVKHYCPSWCQDSWLGRVELAGSFIVHNRNDLKTTYGKPFELFGTSPTGLEFIHETASLCLAAKFCCMHSFGVAINYNVQRLKVDGLEGFANDAFSVAPGDTTNRGYCYSNGVGVIVGYLFEYDKFRLGAAWHPRTSMNRFTKYQGFVADYGFFDIPERRTIGISYRFLPCLAAALDYEWINWCRIPQLGNPTFPNLSDYKLGSRNGAGFGWENQSFWRFGVQWFVNKCLTLRGGFRHANTPIQPEWTAVNILTLDCMENVLTFGGTWKINRCNEISLFYALGFTHTVKGKNSIPATVPQLNPLNSQKFEAPVNANPETSSLVDYPNNLVKADGEVNLSQRRSALGISWGWLF